jgi:hypothetical protein
MRLKGRGFPMARGFLVLLLLGFPLITVPAGASGSAGASSFGLSVEADFNDDGFADLAVGVPDEDVGTTLLAGAVNVLYGSSTGLTAQDDQFWHQGIPGVAGDGAEGGDKFGSSVAAGYFDGDQFADLAVGVPGEAVGTTFDAGAVNVLYGSSTGLTTEGSQFWTQGSLGLPEADTDSEASDLFGSSLAAANLGKGSQADLAVGVPGEDVGTASAAGAVNLIYGSPDGLDPAEGEEGQFWHQGITGVAGDGAELGDNFGRSLAAANLGKTSQADLAVGVPFEAVGGAANAGAVNVLYGSSTGATASGDQFWHQEKAGVTGGGAEPGDNFGSSVTAANLGKTSHADLAVGVPAEDVGATDNAGAVNVLYGSSTGVTASGDQFWHQEKAGVTGGGAEFNDRFGSSVAAANLGKGSQADLAVGVLTEGVGATNNAGAVNVLYGSSTGLTAQGDQFWHQGITGVAGDGAEEDDWFGFSLAAANLGKGSRADLAVGVPREDVGTIGNAGAVNVLYGSSTGLTAQGDQFWHQGITGVDGDGAEEGDMFGSSVAAIQ